MFIHYSRLRVLNDYIHSSASHLSGGLRALQLCCLQQVTELFSFKLHRVESQVLQRQLAWPGDSWKGRIASISSGLVVLSSPPSVTEPWGCCSASPGKKPIEAPPAGDFGENGQGGGVGGIGHPQVAPGGFISLLRG